MKFIFLGIGVFITYSYYNLLKYRESLVYLDYIFNSDDFDDFNISHSDIILENKINIPKEISLENYPECIICLDKIKRNSVITKLKCGHIFHHNCLHKWVNTKNSCPICRDKIH